MKRMRNLSLCVVIFLQILFVSCSENPVSSDANTGTVKISIKGANLNGAASAKKAVLNKAAMVTLTSAKVVIEKIEFENSVDASLDFKFDQPFVEDLVTITNLQEIETVQIPFGSYDQIKVAIDDLDAEDGDVFTQNPDLQNLSILVKGFLNDSNDSFEFSSDLTVNLNLKFDPPLEINQQTLSTNITLNIIFDQWFVDANGDFIDPNLPGNRSQIEENIKKSFEVFEDRNKDGEPDDDDDEVEVKGAIESLGADSLVVSGTTFFVDGNTEVLDNNRDPISFSDLKVGNVVEVRALRQADGRLLATRIQVEDENRQGEEVEVKGAIESLGADSLVVSGTTFFVDGNTEVLDNNRDPISFSDLKVGNVVEVRALRQADGRLLATRIQVEDENRQGEEVEVKGAIESLGADSLVVSGTTFFVDANTEVKAKDKGAISFSDLKVGDVVEVRALRQADGSLLATRIELEDENRQGEEVEVKGAIESLGADSLVVSGTTFFVDGNTEVLDNNRNPISFSDLQVGDVVEVRALRQADGRLLATRIQVEDENRQGEEVEVKGAIESLGADSLVVSGTTFFVDGNTEVKAKGKGTISFSDLKVGDVVEVRGLRQADGSLLATRIELEDENRQGEEVEVKGAIESLGADSLVVSGTTFFVDGNTRIRDEDERSISLSDLKVGDFVEVKAIRQADGRLLATRIEVEDENREEEGEEVEVKGTIESLGADSLVVSGTTFFVDGNTRIRDEDERSISLSDLKVGDFVEVKAILRVDGTWLATRIDIEDEHKRGGDDD